MKVAVFGAGTMGSGIAQVFARTEGIEVLLCSSASNPPREAKQSLKSSSKPEYQRVR